MIALRLAKAGYYGGHPEAVLEGRADMVIAALEYEGFLTDYDNAEYDLNKAD